MVEQLKEEHTSETRVVGWDCHYHGNIKIETKKENSEQTFTIVKRKDWTSLAHVSAS